MARRLLIRPGAIGDFIVSLPAMEFLSDGYTELWAASANVPLGRFADKARSIADVGLDRVGITHDDDTIERLRGFDSIHSWYGTGHEAFRERVAKLRLPFTFYPALPGKGMHAVDFYLSQVGASLGAVPRIECRLQRPADLTAIHPFASNPAKCWPMERFEQLAEKLRHHAAIQWFRGPEESLDHAYYLENLYELGTRIAAASLFVGNDSGISHLAAAVGTPVVAIFGPTDPLVWAPRGDRVIVLSLQSTAEQVYERATQAFLTC